MTIAKHLAVIASTERLAPHDVLDASNNVVTLAFGLNLVTAMVWPNPSGDFTADELALLKPWAWGGLTGVSLWAVKGGVAKPLTTKVSPIAYAVTSSQKAPMVAAMEARFATMRKSGSGNDILAPFLWDPVNPKADEAGSVGLYRHLLGATSTMPAPVPYALNLAICFTVDVADIDPSFLSAGQLAVDTLLAAPVFQLPPPASGSPATVTPSTAGGRQPSPFPAGSAMWIWPCDLADSSGNPAPSASPDPISAYTVNIDLTTSPANSNFDLNRYWITNGTSGPNNVPSEDWATRLADQLAEAWNLPRLLLDALPALLASPLPQPQAYWNAIVACFHDRASLGWIDAPDGAGLMRFALTRAADASKDGRIARPASWQALKDGWARSMRSRLRRHDLAMTFAEWQAR